VIEYRCVGTKTSRDATADPYHACLAAQLETLRSHFGTDFGRLIPAERRKLDAVCSRIRNLEGRERYVACLSDRLATLQGTPAPPRSTAATPAVAVIQSASTQPASRATPSGSRSVSLLSLVFAAALAAALAGGRFLLKRRRTSSMCHACGSTFQEAGDLCRACRHEAAEVRRRAALERDHQAPA
jgi:hypothetical protein